MAVVERFVCVQLLCKIKPAIQHHNMCPLFCHSSSSNKSEIAFQLKKPSAEEGETSVLTLSPRYIQ